jgi:outer membrane receptor for ferrienterochelin and colicins
MNEHIRFRRCGMIFVLVAGLSQSAWAQSSLPDLSLEELMGLDSGQVFGASERLQPVTEAPASVSFITAREIARFGYRTLAEILRGVRGMYVTNDRSYSYMGTRGFGRPGDYNSRILLLINGHRVNDNIYGQAEIGAEFGLDVAMIERVEIIRGPASSLYGDSAFFAVVNVMTRSGASLKGAAIALEAGTLGTRLVRASAGRQLTNGLDIALSGTYEHTDGVGRLYFPVFDTPATNGGVAEGLDGEGVRQFYGRLTYKGLDVTTAYGSRQRDIPTASSDTVFNEQVWRQEVTDRHSLVDAQYGHWFWDDTRIAVRASYDRFTASGVFPFAVDPDSTPVAVGTLADVGSRWTVSGAVTQTFRGAQTMRAGVEFIDNVRQDQVARYVGESAPFLDRRRSSTQHAVYVQHEIKIGRKVIVDGGLRYDGYERFKRVSPRAALIVLPSPSQSVKYLYGSAFRAPNEYEMNTFYFGEGVRALQPEAINTHELVWERYVNDRLRTGVSTYWYKADRLITETLDSSAFLGTSFVNQREVRAKGLELEAQVRFTGESRALVSYALQSAVDQQTQGVLSNSPRHVFKARLSVPGPTRRSFVSIEGRFLTSRTTLAGLRVSSAANVNVHVIQPLSASWELFGGVRNVFDNQYADPVSGQHRQDAIPQNGRSARIGVRWSGWTR